MSDSYIKMYMDVDRAAYGYALSIPVEERQRLLPQCQRNLTWCDLMVDMVSRDAHLKVWAEYNADSREIVAEILAPYANRKDVKFIRVVGDSLIPSTHRGTSMLEDMNQGGLLRAFYQGNALDFHPTNRWLARMTSQISHRLPNLNIFEVGSGTGATTSAVLREIGDYTFYTFTDISSGLLVAAEEQFSW
ncbi:MAG: hypothetical protein Q9202_007389 [Teloschistes flavicans]